MITNHNSWSLGATPNKSLDSFAPFICSPSPSDLAGALEGAVYSLPEFHPSNCPSRHDATHAAPRRSINTDLLPSVFSALSAVQLRGRCDLCLSKPPCLRASAVQNRSLLTLHSIFLSPIFLSFSPRVHVIAMFAMPLSPAPVSFRVNCCNSCLSSLRKCLISRIFTPRL
jgi:hypothetical protein